jgi:predicted N-acetyltransferase YhbS
VPADREPVGDLLRAAYAEHAGNFPPGLFDRYLANVLDTAAATGPGRLLVAEDHGQLVGTATFYPEAAAQGLGWPAGWAGVRAVGVAPAARSRGVARRLMADCEQRARDAGAHVLCLHTASFMVGAVALYESLGYRRAADYDFEAGTHTSNPPSEPVRVIAYCLTLGTASGA